MNSGVVYFFCWYLGVKVAVCFLFEIAAKKFQIYSLLMILIEIIVAKNIWLLNGIFAMFRKNMKFSNN